MKRNHKDATTKALAIIDSHFMQVWHKRHTEARGFTRSGEQCRKLTRVYTTLVVTSTLLLMLTGIVSPIVLMSDWFGAKEKIVATAMVFAAVGMISWTLTKKPGDRVLTVGREWDWFRGEAKRFGIIRVLTGCIEDPSFSIKREVQIMLARIASEVHRHEADEAKWRKKSAKNRFYRLYNFAQIMLGLELPATGEFLRTPEEKKRVTPWGVTAS